MHLDRLPRGRPTTTRVAAWHRRHPRSVLPPLKGRGCSRRRWWVQGCRALRVATAAAWTTRPRRPASVAPGRPGWNGHDLRSEMRSQGPVNCAPFLPLPPAHGFPRVCLLRAKHTACAAHRSTAAASWPYVRGAPSLLWGWRLHTFIRLPPTPPPTARHHRSCIDQKRSAMPCRIDYRNPRRQRRRQEVPQ